MITLGAVYEGNLYKRHVKVVDVWWWWYGEEISGAEYRV